MNPIIRSARMGWPQAIDYLPADPRETFGVTPRRSMAPEHAHFKGTFDCAMHDKAVTAELDPPQPRIIGVDLGSPEGDKTAYWTPPSEAALQIPEGATHINLIGNCFYKRVDGQVYARLNPKNKLHDTWDRENHDLDDPLRFRPLTPPSNVWIEHDGRGMPVDGETRVAMRTRDGVEHKNAAARLWQGDEDWWTHRGIEVDITHYRIVTPETKDPQTDQPEAS